MAVIMDDINLVFTRLLSANMFAKTSLKVMRKRCLTIECRKVAINRG